MNRQEVLQQIAEVALVPVVRAPNAELAQAAVEAILAGGISIFEITLTVPGATALIRKLRDSFGSRAVIGAGTVLSQEQAAECIEAGAQFIVSPGLHLPTVAYVRERGIAMMPGSLTPTELMSAVKAGADMIKIFPCSAVGGAKYLKALKGPFPDVQLLPTGGVNASTAADYLAAGASALGIGSELVDAKALSAGEHALITARAAELVSAVKAWRAGHKA